MKRRFFPLDDPIQRELDLLDFGYIGFFIWWLSPRFFSLLYSV